MYIDSKHVLSGHHTHCRRLLLSQCDSVPKTVFLHLTDTAQDEKQQQVLTIMAGKNKQPDLVLCYGYELPANWFAADVTDWVNDCSLCFTTYRDVIASRGLGNLFVQRSLLMLSDTEDTRSRVALMNVEIS